MIAVSENNLKAGLLNHRTEGLHNGPTIVFLQHDHAVIGQMIADRRKKSPVDLPIGVVSTYVTLILIYEMRWVTHDQVPLFRNRNVLQVVELTSIADVYACEADVAGWPRPSQEWPHLLVLNEV
jgi:hypothetical protein